MILYLGKNKGKKEFFVSANLANGIVNNPTWYDFYQLIKVDLNEIQLADLKQYGWTDYDILSSH